MGRSYVNEFDRLVDSITQIGYEWHAGNLIDNTVSNKPYIKKSIREIEKDEKPCLIVSAGPSLHRTSVLSTAKRFGGTLIAIDGSYVKCLKAGLIPDYVMTLDPHPTRMVRWFGDPNLEANLNGDDYFSRQDLDVEFRVNQHITNQMNLKLVDENCHKSKLIISTTSPKNVVERTKNFDRYWFAPLVDDPDDDGLTQVMCDETSLPAMNTGGTVGTAAWVFASQVLKSKDIAVIGMDLGYYEDTPLEKTQSYHMVNGNPNMYHWEDTPYGMFFTDPTYFWYRKNLLDLLEANQCTLTNCTQAGMLHGKNIRNMKLEDWLLTV